MKNFKHVFSFTFKQKVCKKGYLSATVLLTLLFLILPALIMAAVEIVEDDTATVIRTETVYVVDETEGNADYSVLALPENKIAYKKTDTLENALKKAENEPFAMVLHIKKETLTLLRPEGSEITTEESELLETQIESMFSLILAEKAGLTPDQLSAISVPTQIVTPTMEETEEEQMEMLRQIIAMLAPTLMVFLMYFMVLLYGQSVANSAIMEKSSKLMDTFLLSLRPETMMLGKVCATALAGIFQIVCWLCGLFGGFFLGKIIVLSINPESDMAIIKVLSSFGDLSEIISIPGLILSLPIIAAGFFLYCSLAAISGALASKQEDLAQTNYIFAMTLVFSFLLCVYQGDMYDMTAASGGSDWLCYFPFTAILVLPGKLMVGTVAVWDGILSLSIITVTAVFVTMLAGKVYRLTAFYRGNPLTPKRLIETLKKNSK